MQFQMNVHDLNEWPFNDTSNIGVLDLMSPFDILVSPVLDILYHYCFV